MSPVKESPKQANLRKRTECRRRIIENLAGLVHIDDLLLSGISSRADADIQKTLAEASLILAADIRHAVHQFKGCWP